MSCTPAEFVAFGAFLALVITALVATWELSGFLKDIELRHPHVYERLGRPSPQQTSESDVHGFAMLRFLFSDEYKTLDDPKLRPPALHLKLGVGLFTVAVAVLLFALPLTPSVASLASLSCLRAN
jgi:hypothetical protein